MMNQQELRREYQRFSRIENLEDAKSLLIIYQNFFFKTILNHASTSNSTEIEREAKLVLQMVFTKTSYMLQFMDGLEYISNDGARLKKIIDPTVVASHIRNVYETIAMFNLVFVKPDSVDSKKLLHLLWVHAGLKFRQRFEHVLITVEGREKFEKEEMELDRIKSQIENTETYKGLDERNQNKILTKLKEKDYKITIINNEVNFKTWQDLTKVIGFKEGLLDSMYTYFSLYAHPSNVSVFQFRDMFENQSYLELVLFNVKNMAMIVSAFIADFIEIFPETKEIFESLDTHEQIAINFWNTFSRDESYSINNCLDLLG